MLDQRINARIYSEDQKVMMCSEFVYQCYLDCGGDYIIDIQGGLLQTNISSERLIDYVMKEDLEEFKVQSEAENNPPISIDEEQIGKKLYEALMEYQSEIENMDSETMPKELVEEASRFYQRMNWYAKQAKIPMNSFFVTPTDLCYHADNLERVDEIHVERI